MKRILIIDDEATIREFVKIKMERAGFDVYEASSGEEAIVAYDNKGPFDIAIVDISLTGMDGFDLLRQLRQRSSKMGIIMLSARTHEMDKVRGFMIGADDYMTKPFSPTELVVRVDALLRRIQLPDEMDHNTSDIIISGDFEMNTINRTLLYKGKPIELTNVEFQIMLLFFKNQGKLLYRNDILREIWGEKYIGEEKTVDVNIHRLRNKIEEFPSSPKHIQTVWGQGYIWVG